MHACVMGASKTANLGRARVLIRYASSHATRPHYTNTAKFPESRAPRTQLSVGHALPTTVRIFMPVGHASWVCLPRERRRADPRVLVRRVPPSAARKGAWPADPPAAISRRARRGRLARARWRAAHAGGQSAAQRRGRRGTHAGPAEKAEAAATTQARRAMRRAAIVCEVSPPGNSS